MIQIPTDKELLWIIDVEATCSNDKTIKRGEMEIIEFSGVLLNKATLKQIKEFSEFIKPVRHPILTDFCKDLTTITQKDVDSAKGFKEIINLFNSQLDKENSIFVSWGNYDKIQLKQDCTFHNVSYPFNDDHINIKKVVAQHLNLRKQKGVGSMLRYLDMEFEGTHHRGIDDVRNIIRILNTVNDLETKKET